MASASAMVSSGRKAPPPPPPPNGNTRSKQQPPPPPPRKPPPPKGAPPPPKGPPPPPPVKSETPTKPPAPAAAKRPAVAVAATKAEALSPAKRVRSATASVSIKAPTVLRDENVYERMHQVGEGTYGSVFVARDKVTNEIVALKRINTKQEENGFPITAIREVKILKALHHCNIVFLKEIVTSKENMDQGGLPSVYMVFEYLEYDLTGILDTPEIRFTQDHIKSWSQQLLTGVHYMHTNSIIHRDLKASNLLINKRGELKIADWGLARSWSRKMNRLTNKVITLWYRPPELLLGAADYTDKIDMWSVGCIIAEMFRRTGFLKGSNEPAQLELIFKAFGHPTKEEWPDIGTKCRLWSKFKPDPHKVLPNRFREAVCHNLPFPKWMTESALKMLAELLRLNPDHRWTAQQALDADYFFETPVVKPVQELSMNFTVQSVHEWDCRRKFEARQQRAK